MLGPSAPTALSPAATASLKAAPRTGHSHTVAFYLCTGVTETPLLPAALTVQEKRRPQEGGTRRRVPSGRRQRCEFTVCQQRPSEHVALARTLPTAQSISRAHSPSSRWGQEPGDPWSTLGSFNFHCGLSPSYTNEPQTFCSEGAPASA